MPIAKRKWIRFPLEYVVKNIISHLENSVNTGFQRDGGKRAGRMDKVIWEAPLSTHCFCVESCYMQSNGNQRERQYWNNWLARFLIPIHSGRGCKNR